MSEIMNREYNIKVLTIVVTLFTKYIKYLLQTMMRRKNRFQRYRRNPSLRKCFVVKAFAMICKAF